MIAVSIKNRDQKGYWQTIKLSAISGKTLGQYFAESDGCETVAEIIIDDHRHFFCGTQHWLERMRQRMDQQYQASSRRPYSLATFAQGIDYLKKHRPELLDETIPVPDSAIEIFGDCSILSHSVEDDQTQEANPWAK